MEKKHLKQLEKRIRKPLKALEEFTIIILVDIRFGAEKKSKLVLNNVFIVLILSPSLLREPVLKAKTSTGISLFEPSTLGSTGCVKIESRSSWNLLCDMVQPIKSHRFDGHWLKSVTWAISTQSGLNFDPFTIVAFESAATPRTTLTTARKGSVASSSPQKKTGVRCFR